ncbi:MAG: DUF6122 family protein [Myxococcales bacterium]|nr:DUF6122 family protein [Myxococcales bacterium]MDD9965742.1 DUF6122 family protein [Myxococcales bacterium]
MRPLLHILLHVLVPAVVARAAYRERAMRAFLVLMATMLVDLDHLLADPIYAPGRCSIGFHPLHSTGAIGAYVLLTVPARTRLVGLGLLIHMVLDGIDCVWMALE